ncbi:hypothetical protein DY000_02063868 [Brassica cretica]|uniref:NAC domain-containing protein n=1 Tax=Brassica cretica TaxID=69181 RepID=A0ABQ7ANG8_BRACR|nr:hypothetical protein DY000_02063868 [Brassica cretica]
MNSSLPFDSPTVSVWRRLRSQPRETSRCFPCSTIATVRGDAVSVVDMSHRETRRWLSRATEKKRYRLFVSEEQRRKTEKKNEERTRCLARPPILSPVTSSHVAQGTEEWVVCRVFQKSTTTKKPQEQQPDSSFGSPCDADSSMANEFEDIELPNLNSNSSTVDYNNIHQQYFQNNVYSDNTTSTAGLNMNMNMNMANLPAWTTSLLGPPLSPINSLLLKAFQIRNSYNINPSLLQQGVSNVMQDGSSSSQPQPQDEAFNMDSLW